MIGMLAAGAASATASIPYSGFTSQHGTIMLNKINSHLGLRVTFHERCRMPAGRPVPDITVTYSLPAGSQVRVNQDGGFSFTRRARHVTGGNRGLSPQPFYVNDVFSMSGHLGPSAANGRFSVVKTYRSTQGGTLLDTCQSGEVHFQVALN